MNPLRIRVASWVACALALLATAAGAADFYAARNGSPSNSGSFGSPWNLATALSHPSVVHPGDTIWLRGGTYPNNGGGSYWSILTGTPAAPIILRAYPGERVTIDGGNSNGNAVLVIQGAYTWYWGFEVMSSDPNRRTTQAGSWPTDIGRGEGILIEQSSSHPGLKFINMIVHDTRQGFSWWKEATDSEIYGCLVYYNGWDGPDRGHGHGIYAQNQTGTKKLKDTIVFANYSYGLHAYGSGSAYLNNIWAEGDTIFQSGVLSAVSGGRNILLGGESGNVAQNPTITSNHLYDSPNNPAGSFELGYYGGATNPTMTNNYIADDFDITSVSGLTMTGNTSYGATSGFVQSDYPANTYYSSRPTGIVTFVRPNQYEAGRANITVFNWNLQSSVNVDLSGILPVGQGYEVRNAQDYFGSPVLTGIFDGSPLQLPLSGLSVGAPVGWSAPALTGPEFNAFVVLPASPAGTPTPTPLPPTPTPTRTPTSAPPTATPTPPPPTPTPTRTPTSVPATSTPTRTPTSVPPTATPTRTPTSALPTATPTQTPTSVPPTATPTRTPTSVLPTATPTQTPTSVPPTATPTRTPTSVLPTATPTQTPGSLTATPTLPPPTPTPTPTSVLPTATPTRTATAAPPTATPTTPGSGRAEVRSRRSRPGTITLPGYVSIADPTPTPTPTPYSRPFKP